MMKFHQLTCLGLAFASLPLLAGGGQDEPRDLRTTLGSTLALLDDLAAIQHGLASRDPAAIDALLRSAPGEGPARGPELDQRVQLLRAEVHGLRSHLDDLDRVAIEHLIDDPTLIGLTPNQRAGLTLSGADSPQPVQTFEEEGYSADELRQGKLLVRARRFEDAEKILARFSTSHEARYWLARAFAGQGRETDALEAYLALSAAEDSGQHGQWAAQDAKMLEVKRELRQRQERRR